MSKCFILDRCNVDTSLAEEYGERITVLDDVAADVWHKDFADYAVSRMSDKGFDHATDYFVLVGRLAPLVLTLAQLLREYGSVRLLAYHPFQKRYVERRVQV